MHIGGAFLLELSICSLLQRNILYNDRMERWGIFCGRLCESCPEHIIYLCVQCQRGMQKRKKSMT